MHHDDACFGLFDINNNYLPQIDLHNPALQLVLTVCYFQHFTF